MSAKVETTLRAANRSEAHPSLRRRIGDLPVGFTLVEMLVAISVMGVLLGLLLPALVAARLQGEKAVCQSRLGQIGLMTTMFAADHEGLWPVDTALMTKGEPSRIQWGYESTQYTPLFHMWHWAGLLRPYTDYEGPEPLYKDSVRLRGDVIRAIETFACPTMMRLFSARHCPDPRPGACWGSPLSSSLDSYFYSVPLITRPSAWRLDASPVDVDAAFAPQRVDNVLQPSGKSVLVEWQSWHQRDQYSMREGQPNASHNVLAADMHVTEKLQREARPPVTFIAKSYIPSNRFSFRLLASEHGVRGRDW